MNESDLVADIVRGLNSMPGWWAQKWPNTARGITKPCDAIASWQGRMHLFEAKLARITDWERAKTQVILSEKLFRTSQIPGLQRAQDKGGMTVWIAAGIYNTTDRRTRLFLLPLDQFVLTPGESWTLVDLERCTPIEMIRLAGFGWVIPNEKITLLNGP